MLICVLLTAAVTETVTVPVPAPAPLDHVHADTVTVRLSDTALFILSLFFPPLLRIVPAV